MNARPQFQTTRRVLYLFLLSLTLSVPPLLAQRIQTTRISPANITFRGISMADFYHTMCVGDSATIMLNQDSGTRYVYGDFVSSGRIYTQLASPVSRSRTFYGVSYYDSLHAIVIGDAGLILRTSDKGTSWTQISNGITGVTLRGIWHSSGGTFVIVGDSGVVLRTVDSGSSWSKVNSGTTDTLFAVSFGSDRVGIAVGAKGTTIKTTDSGASWQRIAGFIAPRFNFYALAMSGEDSAIVVGDSSQIHYTTDGTNWKTAVLGFTIGSDGSVKHYRLSALRAVAYTYAAPDSNYVWAVAYGSDDLTHYLLAHTLLIDNNHHQRRTDTTWAAGPVLYVGDADGSVDTASWRINCIAVYRAGPHLVLQLAGENSYIETSVDTTRTYVGSTNPLRDVGLVPLSLSFDGSGFGFAVSSGGSISRTSNNGLSWTTVFLNSKRLIFGVHCFDSNTAVIAGWNGYIYRTTNGGRHWTTEPNTIVQYKLHAFAFPTHDVGVCVGDVGTVIRTTNAGISWNDVGDHQTPFFLNNVAFSNPMIGVLIGQDRTIRRTTNGGLTWDQTPPTPLDNYPNANLKYIDAFSDGTYFIGSDSGVIKSVDHGANWFFIAVPPCAVGSSFYNSKIGIVGESVSTSAHAADTMVLKYTLDGGTTWSDSFKLPVVNAGRLITHWLDSHTFLLYGTDGFIVKVDLAGPNVVTHVISRGDTSLRLYPNPSPGPNVTIEYTIQKEGPVSIELIDDLGRRISSLYSGTETTGEHSRALALPADLHGSYIVSLVSNWEQRTLKVVKF